MARVLHDTSHKTIRINDTNPLNQGQISTFVENIVLNIKNNTNCHYGISIIQQRNSINLP
jgi:uncharacterized protein YdhG (YjbR/CyaY superfamily)